MTLTQDQINHNLKKLSYQKLKERLVVAQNNDETKIIAYFLSKKNIADLEKDGYRVEINGGICTIYLIK